MRDRSRSRTTSGSSGCATRSPRKASASQCRAETEQARQGDGASAVPSPRDQTSPRSRTPAGASDFRGSVKGLAMNRKIDLHRSETPNSILSRRKVLLGGTTLAVAMGGTASSTMAQAQPAPPPRPAAAPGRKPNILVIFGDDIGLWNVSAYNRGMMGYRTPNIDRIAREGAIFTDHYAQQSCTAGRAAFITGQSCFRTGLLKVGLPGAKEGLSDKDPTLAELLKPQGYATGQFGKNHLGDRNEFLPTVHGFDEFFGNLYHLNAEDQPEYRDYQKFADAYPGGPEAFAKKFGTRGVLHAVATTTEDSTDDPRFG